MKRTLIIHSWGNDQPEGHWRRTLVTESRKDGHVVAAKTDLAVA